MAALQVDASQSRAMPHSCRLPRRAIITRVGVPVRVPVHAMLQRRAAANLSPTHLGSAISIEHAGMIDRQPPGWRKKNVYGGYLSQG